jgi:hypothetical protein
MANNLEIHGLKDCWADNCDACGRTHRKTVQIDGYGDFTARTQCEGCLEFEGRLGKVNLLIGKSRRLLDTTKDNAKNSEVRANQASTLTKLIGIRSNLIKEAKQFFAGRHQHKLEGSESTRLPYKEN